jgi:uncharacterized Zn finger protein
MRRKLLLNCNRCGDFVEYEAKKDDPKTVVRCGECGKRHSIDSIWMVDTAKEYERDEGGVLLEKPI